VRTELKRLLLQTAQDTTPDAFCQSLVAALNGPTVVLSRIWVADPTGLLLLTGSAGSPVGGGTYSRLDGAFAGIPVGTGKIGQMCERREPLIVRSIRGDEPWLANPGWIARQGVRAFIGHPLIAGHDVVGAMAIFDRATPSEETLDALQFVADYSALRLVNLRERAVLQARMLALDQSPHDVEDAASAPGPHHVVTRADLRLLERRTIEAALTQTRGRVFGPRGAAVLLGMKPTTLASRIKVLRIERETHASPMRG
jgi:transcriptional regulator with GAF, ATPase, and Fis domain